MRVAKRFVMRPFQDGVVKAAWTEVEPLIENSDIVVFSLPPDTNARLFTEMAHLFRPGQVVTDVSSARKTLYEL